MFLGLNTRHKLFVARLLYRALAIVRRLTGKSNITCVSRRGMHWRLDLNEGIDLSIYLFGCFECSTVRTYGSIVRPDQTVLDIGANMGAHTMPLATLVGPNGRVVAFEPTTYAFGKLRHNVSLNPDLAPRIQLEQIMLTDNGAPLSSALYSSWPLDGRGKRHEVHLGVLADTAGAQAMMLDEYVTRNNLRRVDFIKLDVDGNESSVLRGAQQTLATHRPDILIELIAYDADRRGNALSELVRILKQAGYRLLQVPGLSTLPEDVDELARRIPPGGGINALCRAR